VRNGSEYWMSSTTTRSPKLKYRPDFPDRFASYDHGLDFCHRFFRWHNDKHCHWGIGLLTPAIVHAGHAPAVLEARASVLAAAHAHQPERFVRGR
jgi:putative transposase